MQVAKGKCGGFKNRACPAAAAEPAAKSGARAHPVTLQPHHRRAPVSWKLNNDDMIRTCENPTLPVSEIITRVLLDFTGDPNCAVGFEQAQNLARVCWLRVF